MIIVIEGTDAAGKATQSTKLAQRLGATRFSFPNYESPTGQAILLHLQKKWNAIATCDWACREMECMKLVDGKHVPAHPLPHDLDARVFQSLQMVNRIELLPNIQRALASGPVVFDRYWQSAYVYGSLDGLDTTWLRTVQEKPMPRADLNILIDVPVDEGFIRRPERRDRYEMNRPFLEKVRTTYLQLWGWDDIIAPSLQSITRNDKPGWYVVNGLGTADDVHQRICDVVSKWRAGRTDAPFSGTAVVE